MNPTILMNPNKIPTIPSFRPEFTTAFSAPRRLCQFRINLICALVLPSAAFAQSASSEPSANRNNPIEAETVVLSPFTVTAEKDNGYQAASTLAGSRLSTELRDTPASISVFTKEFLTDIGALNVKEAMEYGLNTQQDFTDTTGLNAVQYNDVQVKMRGFTGASLTRNFFPVVIAVDAFNMERIDFSRGPNSILNGIGGPGGSVDTSTKRASLSGDTNEFQFRVGSWEDYRGALDVNRTFAGKRAALRVNLMAQDKKGWREFEFLKRNSTALAATWQPFKNTEIRVEGEFNKIEQLNAQPWAAADYVTPWIAAGKPISANNTTSVAGTNTWGTPALIYDAASGQGPVSWAGTRQTPITLPLSIAQPSFPRPILDESILPRTSNLIGPGGTTNNESYSYSAFIEQRIGPVFLEFAVNKQSEKRDVRSAVNWNDVALHGDANALLPSNTLPNGNLPPNAGTANPNAGKFYVISRASYRSLDRDNDNYRVTAAYSLDLTKRNIWLGHYNIAALLARNITRQDTEALNETNITPAGTAQYPLNLTSGNNAIFRKTYLDFSGSGAGLRGQVNPFTNPIINLNGVTSGFVRTGDTSGISEITTDSAMIALQAAWLKDHLHVTAGFRRDEQSSLVAAGAQRDPITLEWGRKSFAGVAPVVFAGNTTTLGTVFHLNKIASLFYNQSDNFVGQGSTDFLNRAFGPRKGEGVDLGFRLQLLDNRVNVTVARYKTNEVNRLAQNTQTTTVLQVVNNIWTSLNLQERSTLTGNNNDSVDNSAKGWEFEVTANPTKNWRITANLSKGELQQTNTTPRLRAYVAENRATWNQNAGVFLTLPSPVPGSNPTVGDAIARIDTISTAIMLPEGRTPLQFVETTANLFASYSLPVGPNWLKGLRIGGGIKYRSKPVAGYDSSVASPPPVLGNEYYIVNGLLSKTFKLPAKRSVAIQLNIENILGNDDLLITDKNQNGTYRYQYLTPRRFALSATYKF
jgi:iron complex outermembrane recepter protein